uniref:Major facilitator superfamily (MFS) profile domain-containing protein n=1 Tax=Ascaris lumbricoides TaxID=6252 RepID=A0A9J2PDY8_ASCLU
MDTNDMLVKRIPRRFRPFAVLFGGVLIQLSLGTVYTLGGVPFSLLFGGYLERKFGPRIGTFIGTFVYTSSIAASYYSIQHSFFLLLLTFGLGSGLGQGIAYNCVLINAQQWFPHRIGLATGVLLGGFGCAAFIFAPIQTKFINPNNYAVSEDGVFIQVDLLERVPQAFLVMAIIFAVFQVSGLLFLARATQEYEEIANSYSQQSVLSLTNGSSGVGDVLRSSTFAFLFLTLLFNSLWVQITSGLYKAYGQTFIKDDFFLAMVGSLASIFNCGSRVLWGQVVDQTSYQTSMVIVCASGSALMWTLGVVKCLNSSLLFMYWICIMFCCIGATYTLLPYATNKCFGSAQFGIIYGALQLSIPLAGVGAALLSQFVLPVLGYHILFIIVGSLLCVSFTLTSLIQLTKYGIPSSVIPHEE